MRIIVSTLLFLVLSVNVNETLAATRQEVQQGIQKAESLITDHNWRGAFALLRAMDRNIGDGQPELHYLIAKERYNLYSRIDRNREAGNNITDMENLAKASGDKAVVKDMLLTKAGFFSHIGKNQLSAQCYREYINMCSTGGDDSSVETCFKASIEEAKQKKQFAMAEIIQNMYNDWQDSIASVRSKSDLQSLQNKFDAAQEDMDSKDNRITALWAFIGVLALIIIALAAGLLFFIFLRIRNAVTLKKLRKSLDIANTSNERKSLFVRNISSQISPSLDEIAKGNGKQHIDALRTMLKHIEEYMTLEDSREEKYPTDDINIEQICQDVASETTTENIPVTIGEIHKQSFPLNEGAIKGILERAINEMRADSNTDHITLQFKMRGPHSGNFIVSAVGMKIPAEDRENIFTAFAKVNNLTVTDGLTFPICSLIAYKMGSTLRLDESFAKGTRLVLEVQK